MKIIVRFNEKTHFGIEWNRGSLSTLSNIVESLPIFDEKAGKNAYLKVSDSVRYCNSFIRGEFEGRVRTGKGVDSVYMKIDSEEMTAEMLDVSELENFEGVYDIVTFQEAIAALKTLKLAIIRDDGTEGCLGIGEIVDELNAIREEGDEEVTTYGFVDSYEYYVEKLPYEIILP